MTPTAALLGRLICVAFVYFFAAVLGLNFAVIGDTVTLVWAPSGIALAAVLIFGYRMAWGVALGAFLANAWTDIPLSAAAGIAVGNTLECLVGALFLNRVAHFRIAMDRRRDVLALIALSAVLSTELSAFVGVATLALLGVASSNDYATVAFNWWLGDMMGVLVFAPPLLVWRGSLRGARPSLKAVEAACLLIALAVVSVKIFGAPELTGREAYSASLAVFPFVIWGAIRFGQPGASLVTLTVTMLAIWGTVHGTGPFAVGDPVDSLLRWCAFAIVVAVTGLLLAASVAEQQRAQTDLKKSHDELEQQVTERTRDLSKVNADLKQEMTERRHLETELIRVSEVQQQAIGRELHDGLGQHLTSLALLSATLRQKLVEKMAPEAQATQRIVELANQATAMTRAVARGLYPVALEVGGIRAALEQLAEDTHFLKGMTCVFRGDADLPALDSLVAINLYRVAQEAVNNALKYSQAEHVYIDLARSEDSCRLCISDDGIGIDVERLAQAQGLGMHNMRYRASLLRGSFSVRRNAQGGTTIEVFYPDLRSAT